MQDYVHLIQLGFVVIIILLLGLLLRILGFRFTPPKKYGKGKAGRGARGRGGRNRGRKKKSSEEEERYFQQEAYIGDGKGPTEFEDADLYAMKEKEKKLGWIDMDDAEEKEEKYESWDDY